MKKAIKIILLVILVLVVIIGVGAWHTFGAGFIQVDGCKRTIGSVAFAYHGHAPPATRMRIEIVCLLACGAVFYLHQIRCKHRVPLAVDIIRENGTFVSPLA